MSINTYTIGFGDSKYEIHKSNKLGEGTYSSVCLGRNIQNGEYVAIKKIVKTNLSSHGLQMLISEIAISKEITKFSHPNIVTCYDVIDDIDVIYIVMEYCKNGDFSTFLKKKPMRYDYIKYYFNQIVDGLKYLHEHNIIHRDIKPKNILVSDDKKTIKICDFGFARYSDGLKRILTVCGSPLYMAPEIYKKTGYSDIVDVWSLGLILYEMLFGCHPLEKCNDPKKLAYSIQNTDIIIPLLHSDEISTECVDLLQKMLKRNSTERIMIHNIFEHKWIEECKNTILFHNDKFDCIYKTLSNDILNMITKSNASNESFISELATEEQSSDEKDIECFFNIELNDI